MRRGAAGRRYSDAVPTDHHQLPGRGGHQKLGPCRLVRLCRFHRHRIHRVPRRILWLLRIAQGTTGLSSHSQFIQLPPALFSFVTLTNG